MSITRFTVLPDDRGLLLGIDRAGIFEQGIVYEVVLHSVLGEYIIRPIGKMALSPTGSVVNTKSDANNIICTGIHLHTLEELEKQPDLFTKSYKKKN